jgi:transposase
MYRICLTEEQQNELKRRTLVPGLAPSTRTRLEMVRLSDAGFSVPKIARLLRQHHQTVRLWIKAFLLGGFDALQSKPRGGDQSVLTPAILQAVCAEIETAQRTWTARQIAERLAQEKGIRLSPGRVRVHLQRAGLVYKRTSRSLRHKQDATAVAAKRADLDTLKKGAMPA